GVPVKPDRTRVDGLHEVVHETRHSLAIGADLLLARELNGDMGHSPYAVRCEQRRHAVVVTHHYRVGELTAQRLDVEAVDDGLKIAHRFPLLGSHTSSTARPGSIRQSAG